MHEQGVNAMGWSTPAENDRFWQGFGVGHEVAAANACHNRQTADVFGGSCGSAQLVGAVPGG